jgi:3-hydroxybutyryl-CoA dehydratase
MMTVSIEPGTTLVADVAPYSQDDVNRFGALLGTHGRIHTDPEFAKTTPLKGVIVQGMLVFAPVHEVMTRLFGADRWLRHGKVEAKIIAYTRLNEGTQISVLVDRTEPDAAGSFTIRKENGDSVLVGTFTVGAAA